MTKVKLISCLSVFALSLSMLVMGVLALATQTITLTGEVGFNVSDKSVYVKDARISDETITGFMPGYINDGLILSDATISGSSFEISLDVINTTTNNFDIVIESSQSGVSVTTEAYIPANSTALTEITSSTPITETIVLTVTNSTSSPVDLTNILIKIEERASIQVTVNSNDDSLGTVTGSGDYDIGDTVTLSASETDYGVFVEWRSDSITGNQVSTNATYSFELTASSPSVYYAIFERYSATLSVRTNNSSYGTVTGGGTYEAGDTVTLRATETSTGDFVNWRRDSSTGGSLSTNSTYTFTFTKNSPTTIYGYFQVYSATVYAYTNNSSYGTVSGGNRIYYVGNMVTLIATPTEIGRFVEWRSESTSGTVVSTSPTYTFTLTKSVLKTYYAIFEPNDNVYDDFEFNNIDDSTGELVSYSGSATDVDIPATYATIDVGGETFYIEGDDYTVTRISAYAFQRADDTITSVNIPDTVTEIRNRAFSACTKLSTVNFPTSLKTIGPSAFYNCDLTGEINLPLGVETIDTSAFRGNEKITKVVLPSSITSLGLSAFGNTYGLIEIEYNIPALADLSSTSNVFNGAGTSGTGITVNIGSNVTKIPAYLFTGSTTSYRPRITTVNIPSSVTYIGRDAFRNCTSLTTANFDNAVGWYYTSSSSATTGTTISGLSAPATAAEHLKTNYASYYWKCNPSKAISVYSNNTNLGTVIGSGTYNIGDRVTLTATPTDIGRFVEWRSGSTTGTRVSTSATYSFTLSSSSPTSYYAIFEENYTILEGFTFNNLPSNTGELVSYTGTDTSVEIPSSYSTTVIDGETVFIEGDDYTVTAIADASSNTSGAFYSARTTLRNVSIPDTVTSIGDYAFASCSNLTTYNNPTRLNRIGEAAFMSCINLTSITIPSSVTSLGEVAFANCQRLTNINFNAQVPDYTSSQVSPFFNVGATSRNVTLTIGSNVNRIPSYFMNAESPNTARTYITEIVLSEGVEEIGFQAFRACNYMTSINIPLTMKRIERGAFVNNSNSLQVEFANTAGWYYTSSTTATTGGTLISASGLANPDVAADYLQVDYNNYYWNFNPQAIEDFTFNNLTLTTGELVSYTGSDAKVEIPGTYSTAIINGETVFVEGDTYTVTAIADGDMSPTSGITSAFYNNRTVTSVVIPDTVTRIGDYAFSNCNNLESVTMPDDLEEIGFRAFNACESLAGITFANSLQSIESYAFYGCTSLTTLTMPASLNTIGAYAFDGCTGLKKVTFEETSGWKAGTASLSANILNQLAYAYLTRNYVDVEWTRS